MLLINSFPTYQKKKKNPWIYDGDLAKVNDYSNKDSFFCAVVVPLLFVWILVECLKYTDSPNQTRTLSKRCLSYFGSTISGDWEPISWDGLLVT